ncbi:penicillin-binding transpeptidase domain-containing protein, partial [Escherichia coli]|nr:penicillin-binding transpeptidase domain-containing protein [Escherichia coli]
TRWSPIERATIAFGYGLSITPLQLAHAYATLGNLGKYEPIHIIESNDRDMSRQVVSKENARRVLDMLEPVTQKGGSARRAAVP